MALCASRNGDIVASCHRALVMRAILYRLARAMGDAKAISKGPRAVGKRVERRILGRFFSRIVSVIVGR